MPTHNKELSSEIIQGYGEGIYCSNNAEVGWKVLSGFAGV
jgi:hypothetical protein